MIQTEYVKVKYSNLGPLVTEVVYHGPNGIAFRISGTPWTWLVKTERFRWEVTGCLDDEDCPPILLQLIEYGP